ncbi:hypothetical protein N7478_004904 [Penicillium angulare]|uniref:uncharacterized protein n=1 Tax=Penicillium angulare TaxID=116970 RepID=UPI00253FC207|nr:uncharacterized protein N7478_004904 [Penicillium angulare]KAJ5279532.1 hypothetical protein N7478_004904 [Penicillium angulare]
MSSTAVETKTTTNNTTTKRGRYGLYNTPLLESNAMRKIVAEQCSMNPGKAAVLLQISAKGIGKGVSDHSSFTKRPIERARRSLVYIYGMSFGTESERQRITDATHRAHMRVKGTDYDADDIQLQLWVAATIYWSMVLGYEEIYGAMEDEFADQVYKEFSVMATGLRVEAGLWPADRESFAIYWEKMIAELEVTDEARAVARDVMYSGVNMPWGFWILAKLLGPMQRIATVEYLPERIRDQLGFPSTVYTRTMYWVKVGVDRVVYPLLPEGVRHFSKIYHMADFRDRLAKGTRL